MKKLVFLVQEYLDTKEGKLNKSEIETARQKIFDKSLQAFKEQMKELFTAKAFQILKDVPAEGAIIIEYAEVMDDKIWQALRAAKIVEVVDSMVPSDI